MDGILLLCIGVVGAIASFFLTTLMGTEEHDSVLESLLFYMIFIFISLVVLGVTLIILPENIISLGLCLIICGIFLMLFDIGMMGVMCGPHMPNKTGWLIFIICIIVILYGLYLTGSGTLQYLGVI